MDLINETIDKSRYKFDPLLTLVCLELIKKLNEFPMTKNHSKMLSSERGLNRCWFFQQLLFELSQEMKKEGKELSVPYYWYINGIVVDPESIMLLTKGIIKFKWEEDCNGCQIEKECPCKGNPYNDNYKSVEDKLTWLQQ